MTQEEVAEFFEITDVTAHWWETGKAPVTVANLFRLAELYAAHSIQDLTMAPPFRELLEDRQKALKLVSMLSEARRKQWLDLGQTLAN
jgi:transcriptional regulator with XRE-family HTH domain